MDNSYKLISHINSVLKGKSPSSGITLFIGAGADISSGGITFLSLKKALLEKNRCLINQYSSQTKIDCTFNKYFQEISEQHRAEILDSLIHEGKKLSPSDGYKLLVLLAKVGVISNVITTNFDNLLEKTEELLNINAFQIFSPGLSVPEKYYLNTKKHKPIYIKVHGNIESRCVTHLLNDELDNKVYQENFRNIIKEIITTNTIIFIGYSGFDKQITNIFKECEDNIKDIFWVNINPPADESSLVKLLLKTGKFNYINNNFDQILELISLNYFGDKLIPYPNSTFIWSLVKSKIKKQQDIFFSELIYTTISDRKRYLVARRNVLKQIKSFIFNDQKNLCILTGNTGVGKTCFVGQIYDEMNKSNYIFPLKLSCETEIDIINYIIEKLGYSSHNPFVLLHQFLNWINDIDKSITFVFDCDFYKIENINIYTCIVNKLIELAHLTKEFKNVKFLIIMNMGIWNELFQYIDIPYLDKIFWTANMNYNSKESIRLDLFDDNELEELIKKYENNNIMLRQNIPPDTYKLLHDPMLFGIVFNKSLSLEVQILNNENVFRTIENIATNHENNLSSGRIIDELIQLSACIIESGNFLIDKNIVSFSDKDFLKLEERRIIKIIDNKVRFYYEIYLEYFYAKYLDREKTISQISISNLIVEYIDYSVEKCKYNAFILYYSLFVEELELILNQFISLIKYSKENMDKKNQILKFIKETINQMSRFRAIHLYNTLCLSELDDFPEYISLYICYATTYMDDNFGLKVLNLFRNAKSNQVRFEAYMLLLDRIAFSLKKTDNVFECFSKNKKYLYHNNSIMYFINILGLSIRIGVEEFKNKDKYDCICNLFSKEIFELNFSNLNENNYNELLEKFELYSNVILFDESNDLQEKYYLFPQRCKANKAISKTLEKKELSNNDYQGIKECTIHFDNNFSFLACNLIFIEQILLDENNASDFFNKYYTNFKVDTSVEEIDFFLGAVFMANYLHDPKNRNIYLKYFKDILNDYSFLIFDNPGIERIKSKLKYTDQFDLEFEDSFNPLTSYLYLAPISANNDDIDGMKYFWVMLNDLIYQGDNHKILRLIHAIGQMISIWPKEGFKALNRFCSYKQPLLRKGLIRVLRENYVRFPNETIQFLESTGNAFTVEELNEIYATSILGQRPLEQLHWARAIYFLRNYVDENIVSHILLCMNTEKNLYKFIKKLMECIIREL